MKKIILMFFALVIYGWQLPQTASAFTEVPKLQEKANYVAPNEKCYADGRLANQAPLGINYNDIYEFLVCDGAKPLLADLLSVTEQDLRGNRLNGEAEGASATKQTKAIVKVIAGLHGITTAEAKALFIQAYKSLP